MTEQLWWAPGVQPGPTHYNGTSFLSCNVCLLKQFTVLFSKQNVSLVYECCNIKNAQFIWRIFAVIIGKDPVSRTQIYLKVERQRTSLTLKYFPFFVFFGTSACVSKEFIKKECRIF